MNQGDSTIRLQAEEHPPVVIGNARSLAEHCLHLVHLKAYEAITELVQGRDVLDLGCNIGYGTLRIAETAARVVGVDVSERSIQTARRSGSRPNVQFQVGDGRTLPYPAGHFDVVVSFQVIEHVHDVAAYLGEIARVLRPEGVAVFTTPNACVRVDPDLPPWNRFHVREYRPEELRAELGRRFGSVTVQGLFAVEELLSAEYARCQQLRLIARWRAGRRSELSSWASWRAAIIGTGLRLVPDSMIDALSAGVRFLGRLRPVTADRFARFTTRDLFYRADDLERSLDLIATCQNPVGSAQRGAGT